MAKKKYDPLWEIVGEKVALQDQGLDLDATCPYCYVVVHLDMGTKDGDRFGCGLCGRVSEARIGPDGVALVKTEAEV